MPEAQRDLIAEAIKVQMKQGQVLLYQFASTNELYFGPICDDACYEYRVHVSIVFECWRGDIQRDEHTLRGIGEIVHSRAPAVCLLQLLVYQPSTPPAFRYSVLWHVIPTKSDEWGTAEFSHPLTCPAGRISYCTRFTSCRLLQYVSPLSTTSSTRGTLHHCGPDAFQKPNLSGDSFRVAWACETWTFVFFCLVTSKFVIFMSYSYSYVLLYDVYDIGAGR